VTVVYCSYPLLPSFFKSLLFVLKILFVSNFLRTTGALEHRSSFAARNILKEIRCLDVTFTELAGSFYSSSTERNEVSLKQYCDSENCDFSQKFDIKSIPTNTGYHPFHGNGTLITSESSNESSICYDLSTCHYLHLQGHAEFQLRNDDELFKKITVKLELPSLIVLGDCSGKCDENHLVVAGDKDDEYLLYNERQILVNETFLKPSMKQFCAEQVECHKLVEISKMSLEALLFYVRIYTYKLYCDL